MRRVRNGVLLVGLVWAGPDTRAQEPVPFTHADIASTERLMGLEFTPAERDSFFEDLTDQLAAYESLRVRSIDNTVPPALVFDPRPVGFVIDTTDSPPRWTHHRARRIGRNPGPADLEKLAFASVGELAELVRTRRVTSMQLTRMYLERLRKHGPRLQAVITLTEERALREAERADTEIASGRYRGPLHGIPYGAKDLLSAKGYKTTWGAEPYRDQTIDEDATVLRKLEEAGAVLVAKLSLGALAWGDVWYGGTTRNPWDLEQGSSGSSAGSAACTAAGLVGFSIGTETLGSIVSPSTRCGTTGLRPTFGRVSRTGAMALSWSMDKIGPICRTVEDCALVFDAIRGPDGLDASVHEAPFPYDARVRLETLRIGYLKQAFDAESPNRETDAASLEVLRRLGADLVPIELPQFPLGALVFILGTESATAFDELTRSNRDDLMVRQVRNAWPNVLRAARFVPAVEYLQANRVRFQLIQSMHDLMRTVDVYVSTTYGGGNLLLTNLTGHPCVVLPNGFDAEGHPVSITFLGGLFDEATLLAVAKAYQDATDFHLQHPKEFVPR